MQVCKCTKGGGVHCSSWMTPDQLQKVPLQVLHLCSSRDTKSHCVKGRSAAHCVVHCGLLQHAANAVSKGTYAYNALLYVDICSTICCRSDSAHVYAAHAETEGHARLMDNILVGSLGSMRTSSESLPEFWRGLMAGLSEATSAVTHICAHAMALNA